MEPSLMFNESDRGTEEHNNAVWKAANQYYGIAFQNIYEYAGLGVTKLATIKALPSDEGISLSLTLDERLKILIKRFINTYLSSP